MYVVNLSSKDLKACPLWLLPMVYHLDQKGAHFSLQYQAHLAEPSPYLHELMAWWENYMGPTDMLKSIAINPPRALPPELTIALTEPC